MPASSPFHGPNLELRAFEPDDITSLHEYLNHPSLAGRRYVPWDVSDLLPLSRRQVEGIYNKWSDDSSRAHFAVVRRQTLKLVGHAECAWAWDPLCPTIEIVVSPAEQRKGYGSEVLKLLLTYLFEDTQAHNVSGWLADWNQPARRFAGRHGFKEVGGMRRAGIRQGKYYDLLTMDILRSEWQVNPGSNAHAA